MTRSFSYGERFQLEVEASLEDVLAVLRCGVSGPAAASSADFIWATFFEIPKGVRRRAVLDPRLVASIEEIQRLVAIHGDVAWCQPEWTLFSGVVLRLELYCLIFLKQTGVVTVVGHAAQWLSIPGTSLYLGPNSEHHQVRIERGSVVGSEVFDAHMTSDERRGTLPFIALPETLLVPPITHSRLLSLSLAQREEWGSAIRAAFDLLNHHVPSLELVRDHAWILIPLEDSGDGSFSSFSCNSVPNAIYTSLCTDLMFAETLVHEADHQWLYSVARFEEIWIVPDHLQEALYRSPWRDDPRPLDGLLRGASAFVRVGAMWTALSKSLPGTHVALDEIRKRAVLCNYQAVDALRQIERHGELTPIGQELLMSWVGQAIETRNQLRGGLRDFSSSLQWATAKQREHDAAWLARNPAFEGYSFPLCEADYRSFKMPT